MSTTVTTAFPGTITITIVLAFFYTYSCRVISWCWTLTLLSDNWEKTIVNILNISSHRSIFYHWKSCWNL